MKPSIEASSPARAALAAAIAHRQSLASESQRFAAIHAQLSKPLEEARAAKAELDRVAADRKAALEAWSTSILDGTSPAGAAPPMPPTGATSDAVQLERLHDLSARVEACEAALATLSERRAEHERARTAAAEVVTTAVCEVLVSDSVLGPLEELDAALAAASKVAAKVAGLHAIFESTAQSLGTTDPRALPYFRAKNKIPRVHVAADHLPFDAAALTSAKIEWTRLFARLSSDPSASLDDPAEPASLAAE